MLLLISYLCTDLLADMYFLNHSKKEDQTNVYTIINCKWFLFILYYYYSNKRNIRSIPV